MKRLAATGVVLLATAAAPTTSTIAGAPPAVSHHAENREVSLEIESTLRSLEALIESGVTAERLTREMYTADTIVTGYGVTVPRIGLADGTKAIDAFLSSLAPPGQRKCKFSPTEPATLSPSVAAAFVDLTCRGRTATSEEPDQKYHVLYVWKKTPAGWRVSLEMFGNGLLSSP